MNKNTITLAKYLLSNGIDSSLKIQKILFFFRVEELKSKKNSGYFKSKNNFQAWIYGPVNPESFKFMQKYFNNQEEKEVYFLEKNEIDEVNKHFQKWFEKYSHYSANELIEKSHKNKSWIIARDNLDPDTPSREFLKEDETFIEFDE